MHNLIHSKYLIIAWNVFKLNKYSPQAYHMRIDVRASCFVLRAMLGIEKLLHVHVHREQAECVVDVSDIGAANDFDVEGRAWRML